MVLIGTSARLSVKGRDVRSRRCAWVTLYRDCERTQPGTNENRNVAPVPGPSDPTVTQVFHPASGLPSRVVIATPGESGEREIWWLQNQNRHAGSMRPSTNQIVCPSSNSRAYSRSCASFRCPANQPIDPHAFHPSMARAPPRHRIQIQKSASTACRTSQCVKETAILDCRPAA